MSNGMTQHAKLIAKNLSECCPFRKYKRYVIVVTYQVRISNTKMVNGRVLATAHVAMRAQHFSIIFFPRIHLSRFISNSCFFYYRFFIGIKMYLPMLKKVSSCVGDFGRYNVKNNDQQTLFE
ncbi:uncharacterized protein LOC143185145 [Calliopsis andreniformis]|uniref:uncharacterized protein LOC143185145 n=1 Tax=Calliopsis andreniformis TaxID=337506 RepID=UPI003FCE0584